MVIEGGENPRPGEAENERENVCEKETDPNPKTRANKQV